VFTSFENQTTVTHTKHRAPNPNDSKLKRTFETLVVRASIRDENKVFGTAEKISEFPN